MIREVTQNDKEWVLDLAEKTYCNTRFGFNRRDASDSFDHVINNKNVIFLRGDKTFIYAFIDPFLCNYACKDATLQLLVGEGHSGMEVVKIIHVAMEWAKAMGAQVLELTSTTDHEIGSRFMASLGATKRAVYDIPLKGDYNV